MAWSFSPVAAPEVGGGNHLIAPAASGSLPGQLAGEGMAKRAVLLDLGMPPGLVSSLPGALWLPPSYSSGPLLSNSRVIRGPWLCKTMVSWL